MKDFPLQRVVRVREKAPRLDPADYRLQLAGRIDDKRPWTIGELYALPQVSQVTRHVCVEGWSMIGKWTARRCARSWNASAPIPPLATSASNAPTGITRASTCRPHCIRRR